MANRDKAPDPAAGPDRQRSGMVGAVAGEHSGAKWLFRGAGLHGTTGAGAGQDRAARPDHSRRPDAGHARLRSVPHAPRRSPLQRYHPHRHHHLGTVRPHSAPRGVSGRRLGVSGAAPRRRGPAAQAGHLPAVQARGGCAAGGEPPRSRALGCTTCVASPVGRRRSEPKHSAGAIRSPASCSPPRRKRSRAEEPPRRRSSASSEQVGSLFRQAGRSSDAIGRLGHAEFAVIAPATGPRPPCVWSGAWEGRRILSDPGAGRGATLRIRAGYCAVPDFAESSVDAVELLLRATTALRDLKREGDGEQDACIRPGPA